MKPNTNIDIMMSLFKSVKNLLIAFIIVAFLGIFGIATLFHMAVFPKKVIEVYNQPLAPMRDTIHAGDMLAFEMHWNKHINREANVTFQFINQLVYNTMSAYSNLDCGEHTKIYSILIPEHLPPGKYRVNVIMSYRLNLIRTYTITIKTKEFYVIKANSIYSIK